MNTQDIEKKPKKFMQIVFPLSTIPNDPWSGQNVQQIMYPVTTVINQGDTGQIAKITSPNGQTMAASPTTKQSTRYTANQVKRTPAKRSSTGGGSTRKKRTWKSLVLRKCIRHTVSKLSI